MMRSFTTKVILSVLVLLAAGAAALFFYFHREPLELPQSNPNVHYSYFSQKDFFDQAYSAAKPVNQKAAGQIKGIIFNHHLLAASYIAETFNAVATNVPVTVLLISPNHFSAGKADVITSAENWQTPYGILQADTSVVQNLSRDNLANIEESPFAQEHGVTGIVAFIKKSLPNAKVVPLIFNDRIKLGQAVALAVQYNQVLPANTLIAGSFDFSHYLTSPAADFHDVENLAAVENFDFNKIGRLDSDSRPGLAFFLELLKDCGSQNFHLLENSNSAKLTHQDVLETTSYIDGYFTKGAPATSSADTLLVLPAIAASPIVAASLGRNNKTWSVEYLERLFFGQDKTVVKISGASGTSESLLKRYGVTDMVTADKTVDIGNHQVKILVQANQPEAKQALDAGASVVVQYGAVTDTFSLYNNKPIISLRGNLLSDSVLQNGGVSLAFGLAFEQGQLQLTILPIVVKNGIAKLMVGKERDKVLVDTAAASNADLEIKNQIIQGLVTLKY